MAANLCAVCNKEESKYTCPRCSIRTCSLPCSTAHKAATSCSGVRDKAKYVPLNQYNWGKMADDYTFLEQVGRQVETWGRDITSKGLDTEPRNFRGEGAHKRKKLNHSKKDFLRYQLGLRDINMDMLSSGMERNKSNKSFWDSR